MGLTKLSHGFNSMQLFIKIGSLLGIKW
ncbi:CRISPR-associated DxTHG motif protein [Vibrio coralliilyticus]|uniref:CRISPR-associated DxTHG motif protein n=1 Tax=Vibrio coralliilyticus TaxID=190893 RepID=A0AAE5GL14_9VIBR|nr:CRISPR-associated DxTHG motif protein [Vibrio coralliilyticus]NOI49679.1 CRISPR-associated DxTHG motif protein [Vibrio coralliilyticus]NOI78806.1 CRISPR-associated DxTHG motif protein [Vibrio coralliilyticus]NOJ25916.1 CRISPR-associated DxTHG motif protein [Vibrio coralliilyticus]